MRGTETVDGGRGFWEIPDDQIAGYVEKRLDSFYRGLHPERERLRVHQVREITRGWETRLFRFTLEYQFGGSLRRDRLVARVYSGGSAARKARFEHSIMSRLLGAGYPVPAVYEVDEGGVLGQPFMVMEFIEGRSMEDEFLSGSQDDLRDVMDVMMGLFVRLHALDVSEIFPDQAGLTTREHIDGLLGGYRRRAEESGIGWMAPLIDWVEDRKAEVSPMAPSILHRDFHPMNFMVRGDGSHVVLDWGASGVGDRRDDLAWLMVLSAAFLEPSMSEKILGAYEAEYGHELTDMELFEALAILRRLTDITVSFTSGAEAQGMRPGAVEAMRETSGHIWNIYSALRELTGLSLPEFEELLNTL